MRKKIGFVAVGLVVFPLLFGCVGSTSGETRASFSQPQPNTSAPSGESSQKTFQKTSQEPAQKTTQVSAPEPTLDVSGKLPYKGMPSSYIDQTWLGPADEVGDELDAGACKGSVPYSWHARNGTGDLVFTAYVKDGEVISVAKSNLSKNYWGDGSSRFGSDLPDLDASGETVKGNSSTGAAKPDPDGWDDAEDYANANSSSFNTWDEAYEYWLEEMS